MTSDSSQNGPQGRRPAGRGSRRFDEGDLWADDPTATPPPSPPRRQPRPAPPAEAATVATSAAAAPARAQPPAPSPPSPPEEAYGYGDEAEEEYYEDEPTLLGNPYVLAAVVVLGAIILAVIVVLFFGRRDGDTQSPGATVNATRTPTATVEGQQSPNVTGLAARSIAIATVREGPALNHLELGLLQANQDVDVVGRNEEATWFLIVFPPGTQLQGWVPETALRLPDNVAALVDVADVTPVARPEVPTATEAPVLEETPTPEVTATPATEGPDLSVFISSDCSPGSALVVTIRYEGPEPIEQEPIEVMVSNDGAVVRQQSFTADFDPGASARLETGVPAMPQQMSVSVVLTNMDDIDLSNNIAGCAVSGSGDGNLPPPVATQGN